MFVKLAIVLVCILAKHRVDSLWSCTEDSQCSDIEGGVCSGGLCGCPPGHQSVLGGTVCVPEAPYHNSECVEDHQCHRLVTAFQCTTDNNTNVGACQCVSGYHYFLGRCWRTRDYGESCDSDEQCLGSLRDPYSLQCNGTCVCAADYYNRQRGECRKIALNVGDGCVLDEDCQFANGACDIQTLSCYNTDTGVASEVSKEATPMMETQAGLSRTVHGDACGEQSCDPPFECSPFGGCICPVGYYPNPDGTLCLAELGSPAASAELCVGLLAEVRDGVCTCPVNFYFEDNMIDCIRVTRAIDQSCVLDEHCHTFGAAGRCGAPQDPWGIRTCECEQGVAVWEEERNMCRLFVGIGESCEVDSDCLAGELEIRCVADATGQGYCACPDDYSVFEGLCIRTGLALNDSCQVSQECTETPNTACIEGRCSCDQEYREVDGECVPTIGGSCVVDLDCAIEDTFCRNDSSVWTCQCREGFVDFESQCWPSAAGHNASCEVTAQCVDSLGEWSGCAEGVCSCLSGYHYRSGGCWPITGLFEECTRSSQCYLPEIPERAVCRNGLCLCDFDHPYNEEIGTCESSATNAIASSVMLLIVSLFVCNVNNKLFE